MQIITGENPRINRRRFWRYSLRHLITTFTPGIIFSVNSLAPLMSSSASPTNILKRCFQFTNDANRSSLKRVYSVLFVNFPCSKMTTDLTRLAKLSKINYLLIPERQILIVCLKLKILILFKLIINSNSGSFTMITVLYLFLKSHSLKSLDYWTWESFKTFLISWKRIRSINL